MEYQYHNQFYVQHQPQILQILHDHSDLYHNKNNQRSGSNISGSPSIDQEIEEFEQNIVCQTKYVQKTKMMNITKKQEMDMMEETEIDILQHTIKEDDEYNTEKGDEGYGKGTRHGFDGGASNGYDEKRDSSKIFEP